jgi:putative tricarboxylic transport membrane protein
MQAKYVIALASVVVAFGAVSGGTQAQGWKPAGNVEFVVGAGAGGENDRIARAIQHALDREHLVDSMTVLNKPGAAQTIAINYLAGKKGDTNIIALASGSFINAIARTGSTLHKNITPLMKLFDAYQAYFTAVDSPIKTITEVRDRLKKDSSSVTFAFPVGRGSPLHVSVVNLAKASGATAPTKVVTVIYNSGSDVAAQVAGGHVEVGLTSIGSPMPLVQAGKLRFLGMAAPQRLSGALSQYPTMREQGLDVVTANTYTILLPNGLGPQQIAFWTNTLNRVLQDEEFKRDLERNYWVLNPVRYPDTVKWFQDDYDENRAILKELGMLQN